jgi:hypothetical protein
MANTLFSSMVNRPDSFKVPAEVSNGTEMPKTKRNNSAPISENTEEMMAEKPVASPLERMTADGKRETLTVVQENENGLTILKSESGQEAVRTHSELLAEREAQEIAKKAEPAFEPLVDIATEGSPEQEAFFDAHKGRVLQIAGYAAINQPDENPAVVLANRINEINDDLFSSSDKPEDQALRDKNKLVTLISAARTAVKEIQNPSKMSESVKTTAQKKEIILQDLLGDEEALKALVDGEMKPGTDTSPVAVKGLIAESLQIREEIIEVVKFDQIPKEELLRLSMLAVENMKALNAARAYMKEQLPSAEPVQETPNVPVEELTQQQTAPDNLPVMQEKPAAKKISKPRKMAAPKRERKPVMPERGMMEAEPPKEQAMDEEENPAAKQMEDDWFEDGDPAPLNDAWFQKDEAAPQAVKQPEKPKRGVFGKLADSFSAFFNS